MSFQLSPCSHIPDGVCKHCMHRQRIYGPAAYDPDTGWAPLKWCDCGDETLFVPCFGCEPLFERRNRKAVRA